MFDLFWTFLKLGLTSFGGPIAHLAYFRDAFVVRRQWLSERDYADLVALCQALPGPASSQVGFAIGLQRAGLAGGLAAWLGFTAPSALLMAALAAGVVALPAALAAAIGHGLKLAAATVVAQALIGMAGAVLVSRLSWGLATATMAAWIGVTLAGAGGLAGPLFPLLAIGVCAAAALMASRGGADAAGWRGADPPLPTGGPKAGVGAGVRVRGACVAAIIVALIMVGVLAALAASGAFAALIAACFKAGALVFGGGHVVLPLLQLDNAQRAFIAPELMLAAYGAAQLMPGPLFSIASFLGMAAAGPLGAVAALAAIFAPGLALVWALAPLWWAMKDQPRVRAALQGANAAALGVLAGALATVIAPAAVVTAADAGIVGLGVAALVFLGAPVLLVALLAAGAGAVLFLA